MLLLRRLRRAGAAAPGRRGLAEAAGAAAGAGKEGSLEAVVNLCKRRGFVFQCSEIYGGMATGWDLGPLGAQLRKNLMDLWWREFVELRPECVGVDTCTILHPSVWRASGHLEEFADPLSECSACRHRVRADKLLAAAGVVSEHAADALEAEDMGRLLQEHRVACPACGARGTLGAPRQFNLLFRTSVGPVEGAESEAYLRPETAQGAYTQYGNVSQVLRGRLPLGIAQMGRSFRNEIATQHFLFRTREFDQAELQYVCHPRDADAHFSRWVDDCHRFLTDSVGLNPARIRRRVYSGDDLAHYARATVDLEYLYPFGWGELWGIANRGDYDLRRHMHASGRDMRWTDPADPKAEPIVPFVIEPALGIQRLLLAVLCDAAEADVATDHKGENAERQVLRLNDRVAPFRAAVLPLQRKPEELVGKATALHRSLVRAFGSVDFDTTGSIGKRYRRQDEIGTPLCITVDHQSLEDDSVTIRCRDSMRQARIPISRFDHLRTLERSNFQF